MTDTEGASAPYGSLILINALKEGKVKHVAVVCRLETDISTGTGGAWSAYIGEDQEDVITRALKHRDVSSAKYGAQFTYTVLVGELDQEALPKAEYRLRRLEGRTK